MHSTQIISTDPNIKYRLSPTEINLLFDTFSNFLSKVNTHTFEVAGTEIPVPILKNHSKQKFIIFPLTKDEKNSSVESSTLFIGQVLKNFLETYKERDGVIIMPLLMCQCFHYMYQWMPYSRRAHAVLLTINLATLQMELHDSQSKKFYPDICLELAAQNHLKYDALNDYHAYNVQADNYSCGYYTYCYALNLLEQGLGVKLSELKLNIAKGFKDKMSYLLTCVPRFEYLLNGVSLLESFDENEFQEETDEGFHLI